MRKNKLSKMLLAMICALTVGASLAACTSAPQQSGSTEGTSPSAPSKPESAADFAGSWKLAALDYQGMVAVGNFSADASENSEFAELAGFSLEVAADGTGTLGKDDETLGFTWKADEDGIQFAWNDPEKLADAKMTYEADEKVVTLTMPVDGEDTTVHFTKDGKYNGYEQINLADTTPVSNKKDIVGSWKLSGVGVMGMTIFGTAEQIEKAMGTSMPTLELKADGTGTFEMKDEDAQKLTWTLGDDGATADIDILGSSASCPLTLYDDGIVLDMTPSMGGIMEMFFLYEATE